MNHPVTIGRSVSLLRFLALFLIPCVTYAANPCAGKGTTVFFVNGVFNDLNEANNNLAALKESTQAALPEVKDLRYSLAWVEGRWKPIQLAQAVVQRGVDDLQRFWFWLHGAEKAPAWFDDLFKKVVLEPDWLDASALPRVKNHLELYSRAILDGRQVIVVAHSQGTFFANAALRMLPEYVPAALHPSIVDRTRENPGYPRTDQMIATVHIASPAAETLNNSPWVSFKDDQVLGWLRVLTRVVPGNVQASGVSDQDRRAHTLIPSYLRVDESRNLIVQHIKAAHARLRYPIPFFGDAATVESQVTGFDVHFVQSSKDIRAVDERTDESGARMTQFSARCFDLHPGAVEIRATRIRPDLKSSRFEAIGYVGSVGSKDAKTFELVNSRETSRWSLGRIEVTQGSGRNPIEVDVRYLDRAIE